MLKIKIGDRIQLRPLKVEAISSASQIIVASGLTLSRSYIEYVSPRAFVVGDIVFELDGGAMGKILAIDGGEVWVLLSNGGRITIEKNELKLADDLA